MNNEQPIVMVGDRDDYDMWPTFCASVERAPGGTKESGTSFILMLGFSTVFSRNDLKLKFPFEIMNDGQQVN